MSDYPTIHLGGHDIEVKPQTYPRLKRDIKKLASRIPALGVSLEDISDLDQIIEIVLGDGGELLYDTLCALLPAVKRRVPFYEFEGYTSQEAMDLDVDGPDAAAEDCATVPQLRRAFEVGIEVNDLDFLGRKIAKFLGSKDA